MRLQDILPVSRTCCVLVLAASPWALHLSHSDAVLLQHLPIGTSPCLCDDCLLDGYHPLLACSAWCMASRASSASALLLWGPGWNQCQLLLLLLLIWGWVGLPSCHIIWLFDCVRSCSSCCSSRLRYSSVHRCWQCWP